MLRCTYLNPEEFRAAEKARREAIGAYQEMHPDLEGKWNDEMRAIHRQHWPLGMMWSAPWLFDPTCDEAAEKCATAIAAINAGKNLYLSIHYYQDWALKRAPLCVIGPNGDEWVIDAKSSNGTGWTVTGTPPDVCVSPSIWLRQGQPDAYHGFLGTNGAQPGHFTGPL